MPARGKTTVGRRLADRRGHFMPAGLLASQLATLEPLATDEDGVVLDIDAPVEELVAAIRIRLSLG